MLLRTKECADRKRYIDGDQLRNMRAFRIKENASPTKWHRILEHLAHLLHRAMSDTDEAMLESA